MHKNIISKLFTISTIIFLAHTSAFACPGKAVSEHKQHKVIIEISPKKTFKQTPIVDEGEIIKILPKGSVPHSKEIIKK